ncbi:hypothetical protein [Aquisphaera insulae]|uniref:hypothetical protein n=1 Tax=Aquisphaera insulae TaxID=2712864 RepID=UPI0013EC2CEA|nr:hypothetical protein [Aquisphaera insulae]
MSVRREMEAVAGCGGIEMIASGWLAEVLTPGRSAVLGAVVGLPSATLAVVEGRPDLVIAGAAIGVAASIWAIWSSGANGQVRLLRRRLDEAQADVDKLHGEVDESREARAVLKVEVAELKAKLAAAESHRSTGG